MALRYQDADTSPRVTKISGGILISEQSIIGR